MPGPKSLTRDERGGLLPASATSDPLVLDIKDDPSAAAHATKELISTSASSTETRRLPLPLILPLPTPTPPIPQLRPSAPSKSQLGEISKDEEGYDFAILFKPSKYEQLSMSVPIAHSPTRRRESPVASTNRAWPKESSSIQDEIHPSTGGSNPAPIMPTHPRHYYKSHPEEAKEAVRKKLESLGLQTKELFSIDGKQCLLKVKASQRLLELGAEQMKLKKQQHQDDLWMEFSREFKTIFKDYDPTTRRMQFRDTERQAIVHLLLKAKSGVGLNEHRYVTNIVPNDLLVVY